MAETSPVDAALFAFRKREQRFVLTGASVAYVIASLGLAAAALVAAWPALASLMAWYAQVMRDVAAGGEPSGINGEALQALAAVAPWWGVFTLLSLLLYAAYEAACLRWLVRGERGGVLGLTLGPDTWRVFACYFVWLALGITFLVLVIGLYVGFNAVSNAAPILRLGVMLVAALAPLALAALTIWGAVRLSPATAACIAQRRFAFFDAWKATRGRFWELLGAFVILLAVYFGVATFASILIRIPMAHATYPLMQEVLAGGTIEAIIERARESFSTPLVVGLTAVYVLVTTVLAMLLYVAWFGVNARVAAPEPDAAAPSAAPPSA